MLLVTIIVYWTLWIMIVIANPDEEERQVIFYNWIPRTIAGMRVEWIVELLSTSILALSIWIIKDKKIRWYKIPAPLLLLLVAGVLLTFFELLQLLYAS